MVSAVGDRWAVPQDRGRAVWSAGINHYVKARQSAGNPLAPTRLALALLINGPEWRRIRSTYGVGHRNSIIDGIP